MRRDNANPPRSATPPAQASASAPKGDLQREPPALAASEAERQASQHQAGRRQRVVRDVPSAPAPPAEQRRGRRPTGSARTTLHACAPPPAHDGQRRASTRGRWRKPASRSGARSSLGGDAPPGARSSPAHALAENGLTLVDAVRDEQRRETPGGQQIDIERFWRVISSRPPRRARPSAAVVAA